VKEAFIPIKTTQPPDPNGDELAIKRWPLETLRPFAREKKKGRIAQASQHSGQEPRMSIAKEKERSEVKVK